MSQPVFRYQRHTCCYGVARVRNMDWTAIKQDLAGVQRLHSKEEASERTSAATEQSGDAYHFSKIYHQVNVPYSSRSGYGPELQNWRTLCLVARRGIRQPGLSPDDMFNYLLQSQIANRRCNDEAAIAQNRSTVGDAHDLIHAVGYVHDGSAFRLEAA